MKDNPKKPRGRLNISGAAIGILAFFCLIGFCLQPWITGLVIGVILACNMRPENPQTVVRDKGKEAAKEDTEVIREQQHKEKRHRENQELYDQINAHYVIWILNRPYNFFEWYAFNPYQYPSLIKHLTPEIKEQYNISDEWLEEYRQNYLNHLERDGWTTRIKQAARNKTDLEYWWDITEPLITEERFKEYQQKYSSLLEEINSVTE